MSSLPNKYVSAMSYTIHVEIKSEFKEHCQRKVRHNRRCNYYQKISHLWLRKGKDHFGEYSQLSYVGQDCQRIPPALHKLYGPQVQCLDLSFNSLVSLRGLAEFPNLEELVLDNNLLNDSLHFPCLNKLHTLSLNKNKIVNLEQLLIKISNHLPKLRYLSLLGNKACPNQLSDSEKDEEDYRRYRYYVLHHLPRLQFLDSTKVSLEEQIEAEQRGHFMKVVRPVAKLSAADDLPVDVNSPYTPLPSSKRNVGDHQGAYGKCRFRYSGKHSEGNRFIENNDL